MMRDWLGIEWLAFAIVWAVGAAMTKRAVRRESISSRIVHGVLFALGFFLLFRDWPWAWLNVRFLPSMEIISACAAIITGMGLAFAIWARLRLGRNWSGAVTIKRDHRLIREGPYRIVRHPIYFGVLVAAIGTAIGYGKVRCLIGLPIILLAMWRKSKIEEQFMIAQFGADYAAYRREVKAFIPRVF